MNFYVNKQTYATLDQHRDCFAAISNVKTDLLYGVPEEGLTPFITILIPTYNRKELFREAVESALAQQTTDFSWDILVIDNTPLDKDGNTPALATLRQIGDIRVLYYHNRENIGSGYNWNRGVELARGKWICFLHDDDLLCSDALQNIGKIIAQHSHRKKPLGYIHARRIDFSEKFDWIAASRIRRSYCKEYTRFGALVLGHTQTGMPTCGTTILKKAYVAVGGINYDFGATADAVLGYIIMKNYSVLHSNRVLGGYRWGDNATLNRQTLLDLLEADYWFAQYRYSLTAFSRFWGRLFGRVQHNKNILEKMEVARKSKSELNAGDLNVPNCPVNELHMKAYSLLCMSYQMITAAKAIFMGLFYK